MNKTELIKKVAKDTGVTQEKTQLVVNALLDAIGDALQEGEKVSMADFGTFEARQMKERQGRNPRNPEELISIPAQIKPAFKAAKKLKDKVNE